MNVVQTVLLYRGICAGNCGMGTCVGTYNGISEQPYCILQVPSSGCSVCGVSYMGFYVGTFCLKVWMAEMDEAQE